MGTCIAPESNKDHSDLTKARNEQSQDIDSKYDESDPLNPGLPLPGQMDIDCTFDLKTDLETLQKKFGHRFQELIERKFVDVECDDIKVDTIESSSISVMQFNMLADGLCGAYTSQQNEKTFLGVDKECLWWTYRGIRIVEEISRFEPDIAGIEECDHPEFLMKYLTKMGYDSRYQSKGAVSPMPKVAKGLSKERGVEVKMNNDGVLLIWKRTKFEVSGDAQCIEPDNEEKIWGLAVPLTVKALKQDVLFVVTHLKSTKSQQGEELRERQINLLLKELIKNEAQLPVILTCDLNANPVQNQKGYDPLCYRSLTDADNLGYRSVYAMALGQEPEYTTFKKRAAGVNKHTLDYIFVKGGQWSVTQYLEIPKVIVDENMSSGLVPDWNYPSDHYSIMARLTWK